MIHYIHKLIKEGENQILDFKFAISDAKKIARTLVAFSNTDGGKLLIGVKDNGSLYGIRSDEEFYVLESAASMYCRPNIKLDFQRWVIDGKTILEVIVPKGKKKPYRAPDEDSKWLAYIRHHDQNLKAGKLIERMWELQRSHKQPFIQLSDNESNLLNLFHENDTLNFNYIARSLRLTTNDTESVLINLLLMNVVDYSFVNETLVFTKSKK